MIRETPDGKTIVMYDRGYPLGFVGSKERSGTTPGISYLHNHLRFVIKFHKEATYEGSRLVGFEVSATTPVSTTVVRSGRSPRALGCVEPLSVKHQYKGNFNSDLSQLNLLTVPVGPDLPPQAIDWKGAPLEVLFTYDIKWEPSDIKWASRWDLYLYMGECSPLDCSLNTTIAHREGMASKRRA
eukprot:scaffold67376_cov31-Tisochrysis_lutea.AAC.2